MKISVVSLGCNKNLVDTEVMLGHLTQAGCEVVDDPAVADCLFVNTCSFLQEAVEESLDHLVELAAIKSSARGKRIVVAGCLVSRYGEEILKEIPEIDALVPPDDLESVVRAVTGSERLPNSELSTLNSELSFPPRVLSWPPHRAYLKIGEGCSNRCSYCLIPTLRGESVSRTSKSLFAEMEHLIRSGVKEITLVAQDSGGYGKDGQKGSLASLIKSLLSIAGDYWLRVMYVHPSGVTDELLAVLASDQRVCRYLDIPFQHVSPAILRGMGRESAPPAAEVVRKIRRILPDVFLRTTFMTGFPGETDQDFEMVRDFLAEGHIDHLGVFAYSREEGTAAAWMKDQVDPQTARDRADALLLEQVEISSDKLARFIGREMKVLFEDNDEEGPYGRHQGQAPEVDGVVRLDRKASGNFATVKITGSGEYDLEGEVLE